MQTTDIPFDDPATFKLLSEGHTLGIFQVESPGMVGLLRAVRPTSLSDISAVLALYRPGPMDNNYHTDYARRKHSRNPGAATEGIHPELTTLFSEVLAETYGVITYQEQVMELIARVTGWGYAEAEDIFTAMRKKKLEKMERAKPSFFQAAQDRGYSVAGVQALWDILIPFSDYSFNKAHSMGYAYLTYRGAYLKANHPKEYMTALLSRADATPDRKTGVSERDRFLSEASRMNLPILPPDVNTSDLSFTPDPKGIRYGIGSIKGVGDKATTALLARRPYTSVADFFRRADPKVLNSGVLVALCKSGVLDSLWGDRTDLVREAPELARLALEERRARREGQRRLIRTDYRPKKAPWAPQEDSESPAAWERHYLGVVLTHPTVILNLTRPLTPQEWVWLKAALDREPPQSEVRATLRGTEFGLPHKTTLTNDLRNKLGLLDIGVSER